tara:strand:+ start:131 stop:271 length:141 start_codon:yes stop_codon:yes gene_type:complete
MKNKYKLIKEYVNDHKKHFGFYPHDVEINEKIYTYNQYMEILKNGK